MALPKEPRQKMINMMYLVLTALLALNVSSEILNAFRTVNNSLTSANGVIDLKNQTVYTSFDELMKDPKTAANATKWKPYALQAQALSADVDKYINGLKQQLKEASDLKVKEGVEVFKEDNLEASTRMFNEQGKGQELHDKLLDFKTKLLNILDPSKFADAVDKKDVALERSRLEKSLPLDLNIPQSQSANLNNTWSTSYFHMTPTIASLTILSKFQNDVKNSESQVVDFCLSRVGAVKVIADQFKPLVGTNATYLMPGQEFEVSAGVGSYSSAAKPVISIGGTNVPVNADGAAVYKTTVNGAGERSIPVRITYTKPDGSTDVMEKTVKYTVGVPSGASVFLTKMNVLYAGVDNPMIISAGSAGLEKMSVSISTGDQVRSVGSGQYVIKPAKQGTANINVTVEGKTTPFAMRIKRLPNPTALIGGSQGGAMPSATFKAQGGLAARLLESDFDVEYSVLSYNIGASGGPIPMYKQASNEGPRWTGAAATLVSQTGPGSVVLVDQIRVKGPDGSIRELPPIGFQLK
ncbi:MAG: gliding motility protein GldM [Williamsia sp.]|nr:gliding motility protein GldM [Williamsia sp.]